MKSGITAKQAEAATLLMTGLTAREVAEKIGVTPETISTWRRSKSFNDILAYLRDEKLIAGLDQLRGLQQVALETIKHLMLNSESDAIRLKAASGVLRAGNLTSLSENHLWSTGLKPGHTAFDLD